MRIAVSGTHCMGKSTLIEDFIKIHSDYKSELEPYYELEDEKFTELEPSLDSLLVQLDYSIAQMNQHSNQPNIIFDRCPVDFIAYAMCVAEQEGINIHDTEIAERFNDIKQALNFLDLIIFLPMIDNYSILYTEENPAYRKAADKNFKKLFRDDICDIFPRYGHPRIVEIWGEREARIKMLESYLM